MATAEENVFPKNLLKTREAARCAILPIKPADPATVDERFIWYGHRSDAGRRLPPVLSRLFSPCRLLGFRDLGREEKVAWSVPVDFEGEIYSIEHRKFGVGVFVPNPKEHEKRAQQIVSLIQKGGTANGGSYQKGLAIQVQAGAGRERET